MRFPGFSIAVDITIVVLETCRKAKAKMHSRNLSAGRDPEKSLHTALVSFGATISEPQSLWLAFCLQVPVSMTSVPSLGFHGLLIRKSFLISNPNILAASFRPSGSRKMAANIYEFLPCPQNPLIESSQSSEG